MIAIYGTVLAVLITFLKILEAKYFTKDFSLEFYLGVVALLFTGLGVWIGLKLFKKPANVEDMQIEKVGHTNPTIINEVGISPRELDVLQLMAAGHSNQEIADKLFVSLPTIKTHTSNLYAKLDAKRRTQAIQKAKELGVLS